MTTPVTTLDTAVLCSARSAEVGEPLTATAPVAQAWLILEQPGPWGRQALTQSHLDSDLGAALVTATAGTGTTVCLARSVMPDEGDAREHGHRVWLAHTSPGGVRMRVGRLQDLTPLLDLDFTAIAGGALPPLGRRVTEPTLFVCTNGKRDLCCALRGREVLRDLLADEAFTDVREHVFEVSHLGGHRFAPTALLLPHGAVLGRLDAASAATALRDAREGRLDPQHYRGRSTWRRWEQAAEVGVRLAEGIEGVDDLDVLRVAMDALGRERSLPTRIGSAVAEQPEEAVLEVRHVDGRTWRVTVVRSAVAPRPESCGRDDSVDTAFRATEVRAIDPWR